MSVGRPARQASSSAKQNKSATRRADLAVVRPRRPTLRATTTVISLLAVLVLFGLVGFQALIVRHQSQLDDLDAQIEQATRVNQRLRLDVAQLQAPDRIRTMAIAVYGMVEPEKVTYLEPIPATELLPVDEVQQ